MNQFSLSKVEKLFNVSQHVLIHLCEKNVITPEIQQTEGRGKFRKFSANNVFEFGLALELRRYQIPLSLIKAILLVVSGALRKVRNSFPDVSIHALLQFTQSSLYLCEGSYVIFEFEGSHNLQKKILLAVELNKIITQKEEAVLQQLKELPDNFTSYLKVNLSKLAKLHEQAIQ